MQTKVMLKLCGPDVPLMWRQAELVLNTSKSVNLLKKKVVLNFCMLECIVFGSALEGLVCFYLEFHLFYFLRKTKNPNPQMIRWLSSKEHSENNMQK